MKLQLNTLAYRPRRTTRLHPTVHAAHSSLQPPTSLASRCLPFDVPQSQTTVRLRPQGRRGPSGLYTPLVKDSVSRPRSGPSIRISVIFGTWPRTAAARSVSGGGTLRSVTSSACIAVTARSASDASRQRPRFTLGQPGRLSRCLQNRIGRNRRFRCPGMNVRWAALRARAPYPTWICAR